MIVAYYFIVYYLLFILFAGKDCSPTGSEVELIHMTYDIIFSPLCLFTVLYILMMVKRFHYILKFVCIGQINNFSAEAVLPDTLVRLLAYAQMFPDVLVTVFIYFRIVYKPKSFKPWYQNLIYGSLSITIVCYSLTVAYQRILQYNFKMKDWLISSIYELFWVTYLFLIHV